MAASHITALFIGGPRDGESMLVQAGRDAIYFPRHREALKWRDIDMLYAPEDFDTVCYVRRMMALPQDFPVAVFAPHDMGASEITALLITNYKNWRKA